MIRNQTQQTIIANHVSIAKTPWARMQGLLGKSSMPANEGLVITGCNSVHMFFMRFPIDVIFCDKNGIVVGLTPHLKPFCLSPIFWKSSCAIELATGTINQSKTQLGDKISWE